MALGLVEKQAIVAEVQAAAKEALSGVVADSRGVTVEAMTALRKEAREAGVWMKVVRNTLAKRAVEGTDYECLKDTFVGPTLIAFSQEHPGAAARIFKDFAKNNEQFELKAAAFEGEVTDIAMFGITANIRRSYREAYGHDERSSCWQTGTYYCGRSRSERRASRLIIIFFTEEILGRYKRLNRAMAQ